MILDDFVMIGKTVPEPNSDGRMFVCTAGASPELGQLIRIYPMARLHCPKRWSSVCVPLERNSKDSRRESWKIKGDRTPGAHEQINTVIKQMQRTVSEREKKRIVNLGTVRSIKEANERKLSLAFVYPTTVPRLTFEEGDDAEMAPTKDMFGFTDAVPVAERFNYHPRLKFDDVDGKHDLMLRDWGCYEWMRKKGDDLRWQLEENLALESAPPLFIGNFTRFRNAWLIISVMSGHMFAQPEVTEQQPGLF